MAGKTFRGAAWALAILAAVAIGAVSPATAKVSFPAAVGQILRHQQSGPVSRLSTAKKNELIACVNQVLTDLPNGKKRYVVEAASFDELEQRFGKVVMENHAEWKQKIAQGCAHVVIGA
jgi:hypothetical protein